MINKAPLSTTSQTVIKEVYHHQSHAFKINLSFSFILQHRETLEYCYFYASNNEQLLKSPHLIQNKQDLQNLLNHLAAKGFPSLLKEQRPNTKWVIECIVNLRIHLVITHSESHLIYQTTSRTAAISLVWRKIRITQTATRKVYVSFVVWLLENLKNLSQL